MNQRRIHIKNLGRISEADIRLGGFTVLVGKNSTGKSFASKAIYSFLRAISNMPPLYSQVKFLQSKLLRTASLGTAGLTEDGFKAPPLINKKANSEQASNLQEQIEKLFDFEENGDNSANALIEYFEKKKEIIDNLQGIFNNMSDRRKPVDSSTDSKQAGYEKGRIPLYADMANVHLNSLFELSSFLQKNVASNMREGMQSNCQAVLGSDLFRDKDMPIIFELEGVAKFEWGSKSFLECDDVDKLEGFSSSLPTSFFIESPVHLKLKSALDAVSRDLNRRRSRVGLRKKALVPGYYVDLHNDLAEALVIGENSEEFEKISNDISQAIGGKLHIEENDNIIYRSSEDGREHSLPMVATGIANFGTLGLLLENHLLGEGSYLFIDEPEAHLHPEWVVQMANVLLALVENGVNVVVATHSSVFLKWIEVKTAENPDLAEKFALNHFVDGKVMQDDELDFDAKLNAVQVDISKPYGRLYMRGLGL